MTHVAGKGWEMHHADCLAVMATLDLKAVALTVADPPYGVAERTDRKSKKRGHTKNGKPCEAVDWAPVIGDERPFDPAPFVALPRVVLFGANHFASRLPDASCWIVWDKRDGGPSDDNADCEIAWSNLKGPARLFSHKWRGLVRASEKFADGYQVRHLHPTQKPVALMRWILERWTKPGDVVLDPFAGSAPVGVACIQLGRHYIGCELAPEHFQTACDRLRAEEAGSSIEASRAGQAPLFGVERP